MLLTVLINNMNQYDKTNTRKTVLDPLQIPVYVSFGSHSGRP